MAAVLELLVVCICKVMAGEVRDEACEGMVWWRDNESDCIWWQLADCQLSNGRQGVWIIKCK